MRARSRRTSHALASSSRERSRCASGPGSGLMRRRSVNVTRTSPRRRSARTPGTERTRHGDSMILPPKTAPVPRCEERLLAGKIRQRSELISIDEARGRVLEAVRAARGRGGAPGRGARAGCSRRTSRARSTCRPSTAPRWTATRSIAGPEADARDRRRERARAVPRPSRVKPGTAIRDLDRARWCRTAPPPWCPWSATSADDGRVRVRAAERGGQRPPRRRGRAGRRASCSAAGDAARARRAWRGRVRRARGRCAARAARGWRSS